MHYIDNAELHYLRSAGTHYSRVAFMHYVRNAYYILRISVYSRFPVKRSSVQEVILYRL